MTRSAAALKTIVVFAAVALAWLALASFLPNFHLSGTSLPARMTFVGGVLLLLALILVAQLAMLRSWFRSAEAQAPARKGQIKNLRTAMVGLIAVGVLSGLAVLWYATGHWMPQVQEALQGVPSQR